MLVVCWLWGGVCEFGTRSCLELAGLRAHEVARRGRLRGKANDRADRNNMNTRCKVRQQHEVKNNGKMI
jgi:hypothetical protein